MSADPDHSHHHDHGQDPPSDTALRVKALESLLVEKGLVDPAALDASSIITRTRWGPGTARALSRALGPTPRIRRGCWRMQPLP